MVKIYLLENFVFYVTSVSREAFICFFSSVHSKKRKANLPDVCIIVNIGVRVFHKQL